MQAAKDSFYMALRDRLTALNPARTIVVDGETRPGIVVRENVEPQYAAIRPEVFYLDWGEVQVAESTRPILSLQCEILYASDGWSGSGVDRGRALAEMDDELVRISMPPHTPMLDYRSSPSVALGSNVFWTMPVIKIGRGVSEAQRDRGAASARLEHVARLRIYFFLPEVNA